MNHYAMDTDRVIHAINPINSEFTLCGNAFDGDANGVDADAAARRMRNIASNAIREVK